MTGYTARIIPIDLNEGKTWTEEVDEENSRRFIGVSDLAARYLWEETIPETTALVPENLLFAGVVPLTSHVPTGSRYSIATISPAQQCLGRSPLRRAIPRGAQTNWL